jgi:hypothetical protein
MRTRLAPFAEFLVEVNAVRLRIKIIIMANCDIRRGSHPGTAGKGFCCRRFEARGEGEATDAEEQDTGRRRKATAAREAEKPGRRAKRKDNDAEVGKARAREGTEGKNPEAEA